MSLASLLNGVRKGLVGSLPRRTLIVAAVVLGVGAVSFGPALHQRRAAAEDITHHTIPQKWIDPLLAEDLPDLKYPAYFEDFDKAKAQANTGRYKTALITLRKITNPKPEQLVTLALARGKALAALGRTDEALKALSADDKVKLKDKEIPLADHPQVQVLRIQVLADVGRTDEALSAIKDHLKAYPDSWGGHYLLGEVSEQVGDTDTAKTAYAWFIDQPQDFWGKWTGGVKLPEFENAEYVTWLGRAADRWATLNLKYEGNNALPRQILNTFVKASLVDADYWPAHVAAAEYFLGHDDAGQALAELKAAIDFNPQDARTLALLGRVFVSKFDFDKADSCIEALRKVDPRSVRADVLDARNLILQHRPKDAEETVRRGLARQPKNTEALGVLAAAQVLQLRDTDADATLKQVDELDVGHDNAEAYLDVAEQLAVLWQYPKAEKLYKTALDRAPWLSAAYNGLGILYTRTGQDDKARIVLEQARKLDPFNVQTTNHMRLMDMTASYKRVQTEHFTVMYDAEADPVIGEYLPDFMESVFPEVSADFKYVPKHKVLVEMYPDKESFSVRTAGVPGLESQGASFGPVVTAVSPHQGGDTLGNYHWARVLKHEFTHVMNASATEGRCPRWLTEGCAVWEERVPFRFPWVPAELYLRAANEKLFTIAQLPGALLRPKRAHDGEIAYMEAFWIVRYMDDRFGHDSVVKLLDGYRQGKEDDEAFTYACGKTTSEFEKDFFPWAKEQVKSWGYDKESGEKFDKLKKEAEAAKDARQYDKAIELWEQAIAIRPLDLLGNQRLAGLYLVTKQYDKALKNLATLDKVELMDNRYAKQAAKIFKSEKKWPEAEKYAMQAIYIAPYDLSAHELLRDIHQASGNTKGLEREERMIPILEKWTEDQKRENALRPQREQRKPQE